jgi:hypothetical protein
MVVLVVIPMRNFFPLARPPFTLELVIITWLFYYKTILSFKVGNMHGLLLGPCILSFVQHMISRIKGRIR